MGKPRVKIRGIYTTALTKLFIDSRCSIVYPSREVVSRFGVKESGSTTIDVSITDRPDGQGVILEGDAERAVQVLESLRNALLDVVSRRLTPPENKDTVTYDVEFPYLSKATLDRIRGEVVPTLDGHHRFRIIGPEYVDLIEREVEKHPFKMAKMEEAARKRLILDALEEGKVLRIEHVKPEGNVIQLRGGGIRSLSADKGEMLIRRALSGGRYDGLGLIIEEGDYAITRVKEGDWLVKHSYYSAEGGLRGEYWNINTPVEFYPDRIRYIDLHVDVVLRRGGRPEIMDRDQLDRLADEGYVKEELVRKALLIAEALALSPPAREG